MADHALLQLAESSAEAVASVLRQFASEGIEVSPPTVVSSEANPLGDVPAPAVATNVSYVDGVRGGNVFVIPLTGARKLAAAMMGLDPNEVAADESELTELELSAVAEAANQMMAAAAAATSKVLGEEVEISPPETRLFNSVEEANGAYEATPYATAVSISVLGEPCRLIQLIPNAFVVRMSRALEDRASVDAGAGAVEQREGVAADSLARVPVRVWVELGRTKMALGQAVGLGAGAVVELDRQHDEPVELFVNGRRFASGRLVEVDGHWAVNVEVVHPDEPMPASSHEEGDH